MENEKGEEYQYKDRRQEIVFIGHRMNKDVIQKILDDCLLTEEEMAMGMFPPRFISQKKITIAFDLQKERGRGDLPRNDFIHELAFFLGFQCRLTVPSVFCAPTL